MGGFWSRIGSQSWIGGGAIAEGLEVLDAWKEARPSTALTTTRQACLRAILALGHRSRAMLDRSVVGYEFAPRFADVEKGQLRFFAKATGETNPIYFDEDAARAAGYPALPAPPTFLYSLERLAPGSSGALGLLGIDIGSVMHGEQCFTYLRQIYAGDRIKLATRISDIYDKKGGTLWFVVQDTDAENQYGETVGTGRTVYVVRSG